jgi:hypothetical protein
MRRGILGVVTAMGLWLAACGGDTALLGPGIATFQDISGPWRPAPLVLDPTLRDRIALTCRRDMERQPTSVVAVIDARGLEVAVVRMTSNSAGTCDALQITAGGGVNGAGGGWRQDGVERLDPIVETEIKGVELGQVGGGDLKAGGWSAIGRAGGAIASVVIETPGQPQILASLENGWFAAWWPVAIPDLGRAQKPPPEPEYTIRGFAADGTLLAEYKP